MWKRSIFAVLCVLLLGPAWSAFAVTDLTLVGWWWFDEGLGTVASDSSGYGNNGTLMGGVTWGTGKFGKAVNFGGVDGYVDVPNKPILCVTTGVTVMAWVNLTRWEYPGAGYQGIIAKGNTYRSYSLYTTSAGVLHFSVTNGQTPNVYVGTTSTTTVTQNQWVHVCAMVSGGNQLYFINGVPAGANTGQGIVLPGVTDTGDVLIGRSAEGANRSLGGMVDDARIYNRGLTQAEIQKIMTGADLVTGTASNPSPADGATDVPQDASVSWTAGPYAVTHNVYLGKTLADVNSASLTKPTGVLASQGQTATSYTPAALLDFGQTYYWRIDEVNKASDNTTFKGGVWAFTVEPYAYPITGVTATASSSAAGMGPEKTIDGSGLDKNDLHGTDGTTMWLSGGVQPNWIQYQFDKVYKLNDLKVWNSNQLIETFLGFGAKNVTIQYSTDGTTWTALANVPEFAKAPGMAGYAANTTVSFGGVMAKYVKLTINSNWGGMAPQTGLSEVRFSYVPVQARVPQPAAGTTGVSISTTMNWRPGRDAASHKVYFGTDPNAVANGTAAAKTVTAHAFDAGSLLYGTTYYWKVDEVGAATTYPGTVWSFTTQEFAVVDDFESYNDTDNRIYDTWIDGWTNNSGSTVGHLVAPFAEKTIVHGGTQSMPMDYNNIKAPFYSEANRAFSPAQDWTLGGATSVSVWFRGFPVSFLDKGNNAFTVSGGGNDIWNNADAFRFAYKKLTGNGSITVRVDSIVNTNGWAKAGAMIRDTLNAGSMHADIVVSAANSCSFQYRLTTDGVSASVDWSGTAVAAPYWVRLTRTGNLFRGETSPDGKTWTQLGTDTTILMGSTVYIGMPVCAHDATQVTTVQFSNVTTSANVTGTWQVAAIGTDPEPGNSPEKLYVVVQDSAGKSKVVTNPDSAATTATTWQQWLIPLSDLTSAGVKVTSVKSLTIGVGDRSSPKAAGAGTIYIDDIGFGKPATK
jgi:regulation of enolase protein 1 (concanavalin A-like superfamily)